MSGRRLNRPERRPQNRTHAINASGSTIIHRYRVDNQILLNFTSVTFVYVLSWHHVPACVDKL